MAEDSNNEFEKTVRLHRPGDRLFDRFVLEKRLGQGGMGIVWKARDERLDINVALKLLPETLRNDSGALGQLKHEAQKCIKLTHPRIVRVYDFVTDEEFAALSMEYVPGGTVAELRAKNPDKAFEAPEIAAWVREIGETLQYAHDEAKIVHRDLKPGNIMIGADGEIKVADFGISRSLTGQMTTEVFREMVTGTPAYMGPQQLTGKVPSIQDDIYAFGAMIYEFLSSKPPFFSGDIFHQIEEIIPPSMEERRAELGIKGGAIPEAWEKVVRSCLAKKSSDRPKSMRHVLTELGLASDDASAHWKPSGSSSGFTAIATLAIVVVLFVFIPKNAETPPPSVAEGPDNKNANLLMPEFPSDPMPRFTNSMGMVFTGIPGLEAAFAIHEITVGNFKKFVAATGHDAETGMYRQIQTSEDREAYARDKGVPPESINIHGPTPFFGELGGWNNPGFGQEDTHPVVGMGRDDARAFCKWLTGHERQAGIIAADQEYTLPTDNEWSMAAGLRDENPTATPRQRHSVAKETETGTFRVFPWGEWDKKPPTYGNYQGNDDGYFHTSPVGAFPTNVYGLFDAGGNGLSGATTTTTAAASSV